jgi:hypothetical protein
MKEHSPTHNDQEGSGENPPGNSNKPERPNWESVSRGIAWIVLGSAIIGIGKLSGDESTFQTGSTIATLGGAEFFFGLGTKK